MKFRLATFADISSLALIHLECGKIQPDSFMHGLGICFLRTYYRILLNEKSSVVIIAEDQDKYIHGFCCGSLAAEEHLQNLKKKKISLLISLIPGIIKTPSVLIKLLSHNRYINTGGKESTYGVANGTRCEYWGWRPTSKNPGMAVSILEVWLKIVFDLGSKSVRGEVDIINKGVVKIHQTLGAKIVNELDLPDGRKRIFYEYSSRPKR